MSNTTIDDTTPDELMEHFQGRSLGSIIIFTVIIHAIVLLGTSAPFLWKTFFGADTAKMSEEDRVKLAVEKATPLLSTQFTGGAPKAPKAAPTPRPDATPGPDGGSPGDPADPKSSIERELDKKAAGPDLPPVEDDEEDLFK